MRNCTLSNNSAVYGAGAYCIFGGTLQNCMLYENIASGRGGGVYCDGGMVLNSILSSNRALYGGGVFCGMEGTLVNSIVYSNTANAGPNWYNNYTIFDVSYMNCCSIPLPSPGSGNITNNPQFVNAAAGDFRLLPTSPCIDAGVNQDWMAGATDPDGKARIIHGTADIGAYESEWDTDGDGLPDWFEWTGGGSLTNMATGGDLDGDGMANAEEYEADTDPTNSQSSLEMMGISMTGGAVRVEWKGGRNAWQILERAPTLSATPDPWVPIFTNPPPTSASTNWRGGATDPAQFFRVRAHR